MSQCQRERERERESVCVCARVSVCGGVGGGSVSACVWSCELVYVSACVRARARIHQSPSQNLGPPTDTDSSVDVVLLNPARGL